MYSILDHIDIIQNLLAELTTLVIALVIHIS
jgi:hypothetical protein